jgi:hypothetical protein
MNFFRRLDVLPRLTPNEGLRLILATWIILMSIVAGAWIMQAHLDHKPVHHRPLPYEVM